VAGHRPEGALVKPYYQDDWVTIYHGDCREVIASLPGRFDLTLTDPPYGVSMTYGSTYLDDEADWVLPIIEDCRVMSSVVLVTPGLRNAWNYPKPTWALCWGKPGSPRRSDLGGFNEWEPVLMYGKRRIYNDFKRLPAWNNTTPDAADHPCPKPLKLMHWLVEIGCDPGGLVFDPFMGSGTTLRAATNLGRRAIGIDIEERYCEIAVQRCAQEVLALA
jgi:site-specific DNA-methyltransferase (adenine-specific)